MSEHEAPPAARLLQVMFGFMATKALSEVAALKIADHLVDGPLYYIDLAEKASVKYKPLHRVMRVLASIGVFAEPQPGKYANTEVSELLRSDVPGSMRDMAVMITSESHWLPWGKLGDVLRTGDSGPQHAFGTDIFTWFQQDVNRAEWETFNAAMTSFSDSISEPVVAAYDFSRFKKIVDIGGGHGLLLKKLLEKAPEAQGILFDLPGVVAGAKAGGKIEKVGGDFFKEVPAGGDCYTLKFIIHDWGDDSSKTILLNIAKAMNSEGRVLLVEAVMPDSPEPHPAKFMDINMLAMTEGGCERTEKEYTELLAASGLKLEKIHPTQSPVCILEAVKA